MMESIKEGENPLGMSLAGVLFAPKVFNPSFLHSALRHAHLPYLIGSIYLNPLPCVKQITMLV